MEAAVGMVTSRTVVGSDSIRARVGLFTAVALCGGLIAVCQRPVASHNVWLALLNSTVALAFLVTGLLLMDEKESRNSALAFIAAGIVYPVSRSGGTDPIAAMPLPVLAGLADSLFWCAVAWGLLQYPRGRPTSTRSYEGIYIGYMLVSLPGADLLMLATPSVETRVDGWTYWGVYLFLEQPLAVRTALGFNSVVVGLAFIALVALRFRHIRGIQRRMLTPIAISIGVAGVAAGVGALHYYTVPTSASTDATYFIVGWAALAIPIAFIVVAVRRRLVRQTVTDSLLSLGRPPTIAAVRDGLRHALRDQTLDIWYWVPAEGRYVSTAADAPQDGGWPDDRLVLSVLTTEGAPLAVVVADPSLAANREVVNVAVAASALWLEIARLQAVARAQLAQVQQSRTRLVTAELAERRRLERDLHDGAQQHLLAAKAALGIAKSKVAEPAAVHAIDNAKDELDLAARSVRDLANGILPPLLAHGLRPAVEALGERLPLPVRVEIPTDRVKDDVEATAYFVVSECLANAVKHSGATHASVRAAQVGGVYRVRVTDDGIGGADPRGHGLAGLADRVRALGGELRVASRTGTGTEVEAMMPCG